MCVFPESFITYHVLSVFASSMWQASLSLTGCDTDGVVPYHHAIPTSHFYHFLFLSIEMTTPPILKHTYKTVYYPYDYF